MQEFELSVIHWIQSISSPFLDGFFEIVTMIGEEIFYIVFFSWLYWCHDKKTGRMLASAFLLSSLVNSGLKEAMRIPRPIGMDGVRSLRVHTATGFAFPSGHTQGVAAFFYFWIIQLKKTWMTILGVFIIVLVGFSRLYLGVHWPTDVLGGIAIAILVVHFSRAFFKNFTYPKMIGCVVVVNLLLFFLGSKGFVTSAATFTGGIIGLFVEEKYVRYEIVRSFKGTVLKLLIGLAIVFAIKEGLKFVFPDTMLFDYIRYLLIGLWIALGAMTLFKKIKL